MNFLWIRIKCICKNVCQPWKISLQDKIFEGKVQIPCPWISACQIRKKLGRKVLFLGGLLPQFPQFPGASKSW